MVDKEQEALAMGSLSLLVAANLGVISELEDLFEGTDPLTFESKLKPGTVENVIGTLRYLKMHTDSVRERHPMVDLAITEMHKQQAKKAGE